MRNPLGRGLFGVFKKLEVKQYGYSELGQNSKKWHKKDK